MFILPFYSVCIVVWPLTKYHTQMLQNSDICPARKVPILRQDNGRIGLNFWCQAKYKGFGGFTLSKFHIVANFTFCTYVPLLLLTYQLTTVHQTTMMSQLGATGHLLRLGERCLRECKISPYDSVWMGM